MSVQPSHDARPDASHRPHWPWWKWGLVAAGLVLLEIVVFVWLFRRPAETAATPTPTATAMAQAPEAVDYQGRVYRAKVEAILESGTITLGEHEQTYQRVRIRLLDGPLAGTVLDMDFGRRQTLPSDMRLKVGDEILVNVLKRPDGQLVVYFMDFVRLKPMFWLFVVFATVSILIGGWKGVRGLLGMAFSFAVIFGFILPQILKGHDPVAVTVLGSAVLLAVTLYLIYGWTLKTHAAVIGILLALVVTGLLAQYFVNLTRLTGFGSEDALYLVQFSAVNIDLRGLVLAGMLVGALGVLDDLAITQASVVFQLHATDPQMPFRPLYRRAMQVGRDHVAATVNTLVLAYTGGVLPMLLLFYVTNENALQVLNYEFVAQEIVSMMVGSLGLIAAVPLTNLLAVSLALYHDRLGPLARYLGPPDRGDGHVHAH
ncbi:MAG: YibE/F family protein [Chloroflexi bacterium]|nr:YibE/F family protein [Chloroflexota bacterium]